MPASRARTGAGAKRRHAGGPARAGTVGVHLVTARVRLKQAGIASPGLDAEVLLGHVLGASRELLRSHPEAPMNVREASRYRSLVTRRARHVPVAYLTGRKEFYGHSIAVSPSVLIPRPETELLVEQALEFIRAHPSVTRIIDLGTGSGAVAIALASAVRRIRVEAIEIDPRALTVARRNLRAHGLLSRVALRRGDLLAGVRKAHCIVANLPYLSLARRRRLPPDVRHEPARALNGGRDGLDLIRRAVAQAPNALRRPGCVLIECDPAQARSVVALARRGFPSGTADVLRDLTGRPRVVRVLVE